MKAWIRRWATAFDQAPIETGFTLGAIAAVGLIITVIATGNTFGQRCAKVAEWGTPQWHQCVQDLSEGKKKPAKGLT